ncbi:MAG: GTPase ObgE [Deltaproteobacteria bacterium RIFCSPLOWO2_02_FULL_50_16]|nr:MAG: GTPase ObgE [Deltaproteobacteria bacterium RIFCSPLOWO2_02_FULL_50_16]
MKFIDEATIDIKAGDGGKGCCSFRREKYVPRGGPDGGDGGRGGHIIIQTDPNLLTLLDYRYRRHFKAPRGTHGKGKQMYGVSGQDLIIKVPVGTLVYDQAHNLLIKDLNRPEQSIIVAQGGRGGRGNMHFATSTHQTPRHTEPGEKGEEKQIRLELKLLADVGLVGRPNAGKSTLLSVISRAHPKIAAYPFTTRQPQLGVVFLDRERSYTVADIPGLIEGAHQGAGLGHQFLRHIERTRIFLHLIDLSDPEQPDPWNNYIGLTHELKAYKPHFLDHPQIIVLTKIDLPEVQEKLYSAERLFQEKGLEVMAISAATHQHVQPLIEKVGTLIFP